MSLNQKFLWVEDLVKEDSKANLRKVRLILATISVWNRIKIVCLR